MQRIHSHHCTRRLQLWRRMCDLPFSSHALDAGRLEQEEFQHFRAVVAVAIQTAGRYSTVREIECQADHRGDSTQSGDFYH